MIPRLPSARLRRPAAFNAVKHGLTSTSLDATAIRNWTQAFLNGSGEQESVEAARRLAEIQTSLSLVQREKASVVNRKIEVAKTSGDDAVETASAVHGKPADLRRRDVIEAGAICSSFAKLATLDAYERKLLSRRRKAAFALLLAFEQSSASSDAK